MGELAFGTVAKAIQNALRFHLSNEKIIHLLYSFVTEPMELYNEELNSSSASNIINRKADGQVLEDIKKSATETAVRETIADKVKNKLIKDISEENQSMILHQFIEMINNDESIPEHKKKELLSYAKIDTISEFLGFTMLYSMTVENVSDSNATYNGFKERFMAFLNGNARTAQKNTCEKMAKWLPLTEAQRWCEMKIAEAQAKRANLIDKCIEKFSNEKDFMPPKMAEKIEGCFSNDVKKAIMLLGWWMQFRERINLIPSIYTDDERKQELKLKTDNDDYIRHFQEQLFLEERGSSVSLSKIYVAPHVSGSRLSAAEEIMQWYRNDKFASCMILYGEAGIGKTSLISKIISDAAGIVTQTPWEYDFVPDEVAAIALRDRITVFKELEENFSSVTALTALFGISIFEKDQLKDKLLILDGFDELFVLAPELQAKAERFISGLVQETHGLKILITTRPGYSYFLDYVPGDPITGRKYHWIKRSLSWTEHELSNWCEQYSLEVGKLDDYLIKTLSEFEIKKLKKRITQKQIWCHSFPNQYHNLPPLTYDDRRREVFCIPIILYIACNSNVDLEQEQTIGQIYDHAFRSVITREHGDSLTGNAQVKGADWKMQKLHWQYTKELAYQMLFIGKMELIDDDKSDDLRAIGFRNAQNRTLKLLQADYPELVREDLGTSKFLAVFHFAKNGTRDGIAFVHKTVYEYFAALKLYEDYFSKFNTDYFEANTPEKAAEEVTKSYLEAFRYTVIPEELFKYLEEMKFPCFMEKESDLFSDLKTQRKKHFDKDRFLAAFQTGVRNKLLARVPMDEAVEEYLISDDNLESINVQFCMAFQNFTRYLSCLGYQNIDMIRENDKSDSFLPLAWILRSLTCTKINVYCPNWQLEEVDLEGANLEEADLEGAKLKNANLIGANLVGANLVRANLASVKLEWARLVRANLVGADLEFAKLGDADLSDANLRKANLSSADLYDAELSGAHLEGAKYCKHPAMSTIFPKGFIPQDHGMVEVDKYGKQIDLIENDQFL